MNPESYILARQWGAQECTNSFTLSSHYLAVKADDCPSKQVSLYPLTPSELSSQIVCALKISMSVYLNISILS